MNTFRIAALCLALAPLAHAGDEETAYVWTGKRGMIRRAPHVSVEVTSYGSKGSVEVVRIAPDAHLNSLRAELARLRLAEATDGPAPELEDARLELWIRACDGELFEGQGEILIDLAIDRAERLALRGAGEAALEATQELLLPERLVEAAGDFELVPADAAWTRRAAAWLADPRLTAFRAKLALPQDAPQVSADVENVIWQHIKNGNMGAVVQFGARAVPVLEKYVGTFPSEYPAMSNQDPLTALFQIDEPRGAQFALERLDGSGEVFPLRVLRSMRAAGVLSNQGTWNYVTVQRNGIDVRRPELLQPVWRELLERLVEEGALASDAFTEVGLLVSMDALSPRLASALESAIRGEDPTRFQKAMAALERAGWRDSARPLLARLLDHPRPQVRALAAQRLASFDESPELWPVADDPAVEVRRQVVEALRRRRRQALSISGFEQTSMTYSGSDSDRGLAQGGKAALEKLLRDEEPEIYLVALEILIEHKQPDVSGATVRALAGHHDARVRRLVPRLQVAGVPDPDVLATLAGDPDADVLDGVDDVLRNLANFGPLPTPERPLAEGWRVFHLAASPWSDAYLPALVKRLSGAERIPRSMGPAPFVACRTGDGARALAVIARDTASADLRAGLVDVLADRSSWAGELRGWHLVEPELARDVLARAWRDTPRRDVWEETLQALVSGPQAYGAAGLSWSSTPELPWSLRLLGLYVSRPLADEAWCDRLLALLADTRELHEQAHAWSRVLWGLGQNMPDRALAAHLMADLAATESVPEPLLEQLLGGLSRVTVPDPETALRLLERWGDQGGSFVPLAILAVQQVQVSDDAPRLDLFEHLLRVDGDIATHTAQAMGRLHLPAHLPLLERALMGELGAAAGQRAALQQSAARALACYLDDRAAELLLRGVGATSDAEVREVCFEALDTIRRYQDERARWKTRAGSEQARAEEIAELVGLIESGEGVQRVEAVHALATLQAVEELPRLVRLTGSKDAALAKAAKETLDAIRRAQERKQD